MYSRATRRMYEYTLENGRLRVDRLTDFGRVSKHEIILRDIEALALPDDPAVARYKKGGGEKIRKYDYTSYREGARWYTLIAREDGEKVKLLLDLDRAAIDYIRRENREAVRIQGGYVTPSVSFADSALCEGAFGKAHRSFIHSACLNL